MLHVRASHTIVKYRKRSLNQPSFTYFVVIVVISFDSQSTSTQPAPSLIPSPLHRHTCYLLSRAVSLGRLSLEG